MNLYALLGGIALAIAIFLGGVKTGGAVKQVEWDGERAARVNADLVQVRVERVEVPKIVERVVTRTVTVTQEVERAQDAVETVIPPDCVLPDGYGLLLVAAARGFDPEGPGVPDDARGAYGCREVLAATLADLKAGWINSARLTGLQEYVRLTEGSSHADRNP